MCTSKVYVSLRKRHESVVSYVNGLLFHWYFMHVKKTLKISLHATSTLHVHIQYNWIHNCIQNAIMEQKLIIRCIKQLILLWLFSLVEQK